MPMHLAIDANYIGGTVRLEGAKVLEVPFVNSQGDAVVFTLAPRISLTLLNNSSQVPFKVKSIKAGNLYTGFVIGFPNPVTIDIEWTASERA